MLCASVATFTSLGCEPQERDVSTSAQAVSDVLEEQLEPSPPPLEMQRVAMVIEKFTANPKVQNGTAYEMATMSLEGIKRLVAPGNAVVRHSGEKGVVRIHLAKMLMYAGHPPHVMNVESAKRYMGIAFKRVGDELHLATFGEWDSHIEGGASVGLEIIVPAGFQHEARTDYSGENSAAHEVEPLEFGGTLKVTPKEYTQGWWGPVKPGPGWTSIQTDPDYDFLSRN